MSIAEMSATLRKEVLERLKTQYATSSGRTPDDRLKNYTNYTSTKQIRSDTDTSKGRHESVMSRGAFEALAGDLNLLLEKKNIASILSDSLGSDVTFDAFKTFLTNKLGQGSSRPRVADGFTYTGASRIGSDSGLTIATQNVKQGEAPSDRDVLILRNTPIGNLVEYYVEFLSNNVIESPRYTKEQLQKELKSLFNAGHLTGAFNARLVRALGLRKDTAGSIRFDTTKGNLVTQAEVELNKIMTLLTDADYLSSNLVNDIGLFITTDKRLYKNKVNLLLTTEVQFAKTNQDVGALLQQAGHAVSALTKSVKEDVSQVGQELAVQAALTKLYSNLDKIALLVNTKAKAYKALGPRLNKEAREHLDKVLLNTSSIEKIISSPGSKSIPEHIQYIVANVLAKIESKEEASKAAVLGNLFSSIPAKITKAKVTIKKPTTKSKTVTSVPTIGSAKSLFSLSTLQALLDAHLQDVISANMGSGQERRVLNYRTGRFASSAKVERLSQSRDGMITAFYSYMKNPYATFSQGGRQQFPKTRDPKLLIAMSIREIAATKVGNRLRAVSV